MAAPGPGPPWSALVRGAEWLEPKIQVSDALVGNMTPKRRLYEFTTVEIKMVKKNKVNYFDAALPY